MVIVCAQYIIEQDGHMVSNWKKYKTEQIQKGKFLDLKVLHHGPSLTLVRQGKIRVGGKAVFSLSPVHERDKEL